MHVRGQRERRRVVAARIAKSVATQVQPEEAPEPQNAKRPAITGRLRGVSDGARTHDRLDHNQELYQLSYAHRGLSNLPADR